MLSDTGVEMIGVTGGTVEVASRTVGSTVDGVTKDVVDEGVTWADWPEVYTTELSTGGSWVDETRGEAVGDDSVTGGPPEVEDEGEISEVEGF